jgi:hypothetical protein
MASKELDRLRPVKNAEEFEHYRLMTAIRVQYLTYQLIESRANAPEMTEAGLVQLLKELEALHPEELDKRFTKLNTGSLYPAEIVQENELRNAKINVLRARLQRLK